VFRNKAKAGHARTRPCNSKLLHSLSTLSKGGGGRSNQAPKQSNQTVCPWLCQEPVVVVVRVNGA
jgi:hypothetical protein